MNTRFAIPLVFVALPAAAEDYQLFTNASAFHSEQAGRNEMQYGASAQYFFERRSALGPYDQFEYINTINNVAGSALHYDDTLSAALSGEYFVGELAFSAAVQALDGDHVASNVSAGYLLSDDFIVRAHANHIEGGDTNYSVSSSYNMQLNRSDYLGATVSLRDDLESGGINVKYFNALNNGHYVGVGASYSTYVSEFRSYNRRSNSWNTNAAYYISKATGFSLGWDDDEMLSLGARHFFTPSVALAVNVYHREGEAGYTSPDYTAYALTFSWQT